MKSENKSLVNDLSAAILNQLHGLNAKSAKKLVKAVDETAQDIVKRFTKLKKEEEKEVEKDAIKATKKAVSKANKIAKAKEKAAKKAELASKIAIVTDEDSSVEMPKPKPAAHTKKATAKKPVTKKSPAKKPSAAPSVESATFND